MSQNDMDAEFGGGGGGADERQQQYSSWQRQQHQQYQAPPYQQQESQPMPYHYPSLQEQQQHQHQQLLSQQQQQHYQPQWFAQQLQQQPPQRQVPMRNPQTPQYPPAEAASFLPSTGHVSAFTATPGGGLYRHATPAGTAGAGSGGAPGGYGIVGQTPMTASSFGSSVGAPTPQHAGGVGAGTRGGGPGAPFGHGGGPGASFRQQTTGEAMDHPGVGAAGAGGYGGAPGLLRGNDPLRPTPVVRRMGVGGGGVGGGGGGFSQQQPMQQQKQQMGMQGTPSPYNTSAMPSPFPPPQHAQHQQHFGQQREQQSQQRMQQKKRLPSVKEEEDPSMLRYESRPGLDTSPMAGNENLQGAEGGGQGRGQIEDAEAGETLPTRTPMPPAGHSRRVSPGKRGEYPTMREDSILYRCRAYQ
jgi:hypothetical protein